MAAPVLKYAGKKVLKNQMETREKKKLEEDKDPFYTIGKDKNGADVKVRKVKGDPHIPEHDREILDKVRNRAFALDASFGPIGWSTVIGFVPGAGDVADTALSLMIVIKCCKIKGGLPATKMFRMIGNVVLDFGIGLVPIVGDLADGLYRCNKRNVAILEQYLEEMYVPPSEKKKGRSARLAQQKEARGREDEYYYAAEPRLPEQASIPQNTEGDQVSSRRKNERGWRQGLGSGRRYVEQVKQDTSRFRR